MSGLAICCHWKTFWSGYHCGDVAIQLETVNYITVPESRICLVSDEIFSCENLVLRQRLPRNSQC